MPVEDGQRTFSVVPDRITPRSDPDANTISRPMTSKQARKQYLARSRTPRLSREEQRRQERELQAQIRKDLKQKEDEARKASDRERAQARAKAQREKQKIKEDAEKAAKRKAGVPMKPPRPSQATIASFARGKCVTRKEPSDKKGSATGADVSEETFPSLDRPVEVTSELGSRGSTEARTMPGRPAPPTIDDNKANTAEEGQSKVMGPPLRPAHAPAKKRKLPFLIPGQKRSRLQPSPKPKAASETTPHASSPSPSRSPKSSPCRRFHVPKFRDDRTFDIGNGAHRFLRPRAEQPCPQQDIPRTDTEDLEDFLASASQLAQEIGGHYLRPHNRACHTSTIRSERASVVPAKARSSIKPSQEYEPPGSGLAEPENFSLGSDSCQSLRTKHKLEHVRESRTQGKRDTKKSSFEDEPKCRAIPGLDDLLPFLSTQDCSLSAEDIADIETPKQARMSPRGNTRRRGEGPERYALQSSKHDTPNIRQLKHTADFTARRTKPPNKSPPNTIAEPIVFRPVHELRVKADTQIPGGSKVNCKVSASPQPPNSTSRTLGAPVTTEDLDALLAADWDDDLDADIEKPGPSGATSLVAGQDIPDTSNTNGRAESCPILISSQDMRALTSFPWSDCMD